MIVEVAVLPSAVLEAERKVAVVVDALRASATVTALFDAGADQVIVASDPDEAFAIAAGQRDRYLICGERGGLPPPGFDYGNSPVQIAGLGITGRQVILTTSNGTRALRAVADARFALVGTGRNASRVATRALEAAERMASDLTIVCAGDEHGSMFSLEDFFIAGFLAELIAARRAFSWPVDEADPRSGDPNSWALDESAVVARRFYHSYLGGQDRPDHPSAETVRAAFHDARNGRTLPRIGFGADLEYCAEVNCSSALPRLSRRDGRFILIGDQDR